MALVVISDTTHQALKLAAAFERKEMKAIVEEALEPRLEPYFLLRVPESSSDNPRQHSTTEG